MTTFTLKIIALMFMVIDHVNLFFSYTPEWFRYIGRLSAPLFIFTMVNGFSYTRNKKVYLFRIYSFGLFMSIMNYILNSLNQENKVTNNIFVTLFSIAIIIRLIELKRENYHKWIIYLSSFCFCQTISVLLCYYMDLYSNNSNLLYLLIALTGNIFYNEGGFVFVLLGILFYYIKNNKKHITIYYAIFCFIYTFLNNSHIIPKFMTRLNYYHGKNILFNIFNFIFPVLGFDVLGYNKNSYQWMMIGALPFILLYNGKRGKEIKYFFYIFYPLHILILFILKKYYVWFI